MFYWAPLTLDKSQVSYRMHSADVENHLEAQTEVSWDGNKDNRDGAQEKSQGKTETQEDSS